MTDAIPPIPLKWDGEALTPATQHWSRIADRHFVVGETYTMEERLERSAKSHAFYFATVTELWRSLPEGLAIKHPTADHLRRYALIQTGFHNQRDVVCGSKAEALRLATLIPTLDPYAVAVIDGLVVKILTAQSQNYRAMDKATFAASKQAVLEYLSDLIGVTPGEAKRHARAA